MTDRKRAAARQLQQRQCDSLPLLGALIAETQPAVEELMMARVMTWIDLQQQARDHRAGLWRRARHALDHGYDPAT